MIIAMLRQHIEKRALTRCHCLLQVHCFEASMANMVHAHCACYDCLLPITWEILCNEPDQH